MDEERFKGQNVLITGGSSGIGLEIARLFGRLEANLFLVARNQDRLGQAKAALQQDLGPGVLCNLESRTIRWIKVSWPWLYFKIVDSLVARDRRRRGVAG